MICCKIIADYENINASFSGLLNKLSKYAEVLWDNDYLYVGETKTNFLTERKIINILKANNYTKYFIDIYSKENQPKESEFVNGWLTDKLIKISYNQYEIENQKMLKETMIGLQMLEQQVDDILKQQKSKIKQEGGGEENVAEK